MRWWDDLWLNESFAEWARPRQAEGDAMVLRMDDPLHHEKTWAYRQDQLSSTHPVVAPIRDLHDVEVNFDGITYAKGASVLEAVGRLCRLPRRVRRRAAQLFPPPRLGQHPARRPPRRVGGIVRP